MVAPLWAQLHGNYCRSVIFSSTSLNFLNATEFEYSASSCTGSIAGKGTYSIAKKNLVLNFTAPEPTAPGCTLKITETSSRPDSVTFHFSIFDRERLVPLPYAPILIKNPAGDILIGAETDTLGQLRFTVPYSEEKVWLEFRYIFYQSCEMQLPANKNYRIDLAAALTPPEWIKPGTSWKWPIKSQKGNKLTFRHNPDQILLKVD